MREFVEFLEEQSVIDMSQKVSTYSWFGFCKGSRFEDGTLFGF